jgi:hypothetical protein
MRSGLIVFLLASSLGLALAIESNREPASEVAAGLARAAVVGVILGSNHWAPYPADVQSRLLLQQVVSDEGWESRQDDLPGPSRIRQTAPPGKSSSR